MTIWAPVVAALGASLLTTVGLLARDGLRGKRARRSARLAAYEGLLAESLAVGQLASTMRATMKLRSGIWEGVEVALRLRKPVDPFDIADRIWGVFQPLFAAGTKVWAVGTKESIPLANDLVDKCVHLLGIATEAGGAGTGLSLHIQGMRWTAEQDQALQDGLRSLGEARRGLGNLLRREGREPQVDLLARPTR